MSKLRRALQDARDILARVGESFWVGKLDQLLAKPDLSSRDAKEVLSWFGGVGSFNDVLISAVNGDQVAPADEDVVNDRLSDARHRIYEAAKTESG